MSSGFILVPLSPAHIQNLSGIGKTESDFVKFVFNQEKLGWTASTRL